MRCAEDGCALPSALCPFRFALCVAAVLGAALPGCSRSSVGSASAAAAPPPSVNAHVAVLDLAYDKPAVVGTAAHASTADLPVGKTVDLEWGTVTGGWVVDDYYHFRGKKYSETTRSLGHFPVDADGRVKADFVVPEDYGGVHEVIARIDG